jgi:hypothetical protein
MTQYTTRPLTPDTWADFAALVEANNGVWSGCWCIGFHPEGITKYSTVSGNREAPQTRTLDTHRPRLRNAPHWHASPLS